MSDNLRRGFQDSGYQLQTGEAAAAEGLIEVYPHPALLTLMKATERLPYKARKIRIYWPDLMPKERKRNLIHHWRMIVSQLDSQISGVCSAMAVPEPEASGWELKAFEDKLDAIICAWVGACYLDMRAKGFGDADSAIWIPTSVMEA